MGKRSREKESFWRKLVRRQASSGLSIRKFCDQEGVSEASFYAWRRELSKRDEAASPRPAPASAEPADGAASFVPLALIDGPGTLEIVHPLGCRIRITGQIDEVALRQVLKALDERDRA